MFFADLERLDSLSVFQRPSVTDPDSPEMRSTGRISTSHMPGVDFHPSNIHGGIDASGAPREVMIDNLEIITKTDTSLNVQSLPDFFFEEEGSSNTDKDGIQFESNFPHSGPEVDFGSKGEADVGIGGNSDFSPKFPGIGSAGKDVEFDVKHGAAVGQPRASGTAEVKFPDTNIPYSSSSSEVKVGDVDVGASKDSRFSLKKYFSGSKSKGYRISSSDEPNVEKKPGKIQKFFGRKSGNFGDHGGHVSVEMSQPSGNLDGNVEAKQDVGELNTTPMDIDTAFAAPTVGVDSGSSHFPGGNFSANIGGSKDSGSETSDGEGGRIKRKMKIPKFGVGIGGGVSGRGSKPGDDSGSETSDGEGGRIKRKLKVPKF